MAQAQLQKRILEEDTFIPVIEDFQYQQEIDREVHYDERSSQERNVPLQSQLEKAKRELNNVMKRNS
jgi:hypothetical protein